MITDNMVGQELYMVCQYEGTDKLKVIVRDIIRLDGGKDIGFTPYNYHNNTPGSLNVKSSDPEYLMMRTTLKNAGDSLIKGDYIIGKVTVVKTGLFKKEISLEGNDLHIIREVKNGTKPAYIVDGNFTKQQYEKLEDDRYLYGIPSMTEDMKVMVHYDTFREAVGSLLEAFGMKNE